ncbi:MAG: uracil-DNA glycosylase [Verrucomicrobiota bacterium]
MAKSAGRRLLISEHVTQLLQCRRCPRMQSAPVSGGPVVSDVILVGQAPGPREPVLQRPFAWTAGRTLFQWFEQFCGMNENEVRARIYFAAVCRCFPGKSTSGGDRVPAPDEVLNCSSWMDEELQILRPQLVIPVGRLAIGQFIPCPKLADVIGQRLRAERAHRQFDVIPLPHPSGASPWHKIPPGNALLRKAMQKIALHPAMTGARRKSPRHIGRAERGAPARLT